MRTKYSRDLSSLPPCFFFALSLPHLVFFFQSTPFQCSCYLQALPVVQVHKLARRNFKRNRLLVELHPRRKKRKFYFDFFFFFFPRRVAVCLSERLIIYFLLLKAFVVHWLLDRDIFRNGLLPR